MIYLDGNLSSKLYGYIYGKTRLHDLKTLKSVSFDWFPLDERDEPTSDKLLDFVRFDTWEEGEWLVMILSEYIMNHPEGYLFPGHPVKNFKL